jgi:acylphosphatase
VERIAKHALVRGVVQGVGFRWYTKSRARELGVAGWVRNLPDGSVEVWAEGAATAVADLLRWLERGPPAARVETVEVSDETPSGAERFEVSR